VLDWFKHLGDLEVDGRLTKLDLKETVYKDVHYRVSEKSEPMGIKLFLFLFTG
jgi:hypothetical protein